MGITSPLCFTEAFITKLDFTRRESLHPHFGIPEWKAKYSASNEGTLPLLLLPFEPTQIPLLGQHIRLIFRHGKYMDMIDQSLTSYESVIGMSVLDQDESLPIAVVCEVIEEELDIKSGYRGFTSMEVGLRAVGRVLRCNEPPDAYTTDYFHGRKALSVIRLGRFVEYQDEELTESELVMCAEHLKNIESLLALPSQFLTNPEGHELPSKRQKLYADAHTYLASQMRDVAAASWAVFTLIEDDSKISSVIVQALSTKNILERLRLGLTAVLDVTASSTRECFDEKDSFQ
ncbi:hypothetical protein ACHAWO_000420 [Cyclotella atomus]|jgi:hypothetical protein|uniref:Lon N-terminal domain-containing protein n=1 Tax=Cyclotella atomus TaxID=382360 RepID=A0ABD3PRE8_9STRA